MKRRSLIVLCIILLLSIAALFTGGSSLNLIVLPFSLTAKLLRGLSLSGNAGNVTAIILLILISVLPLLLKIRKKWNREDLLLILSSVSILYTLYYLINPTLRPLALGGEVGEFLLIGSVYSILICWGIIRLMKHCKTADTPAIYEALELFLLICSAERAFAVISRFVGFLKTTELLSATNTMPGLNLIPTYIFLFLGFAVAAVEYGLNAFVLYLGAGLVRKMKHNPYSTECTAASANISKWCARVLVIITASHMLLNLSQVFFAKYLHQIVAQLQFPVLSIAVVFALMVLSGILTKGKAIKDDNDLFI